MRENRNFTLPIIGRVQHGEKIMNNGKTKVVDYGHFISKIQEKSMQPYSDRFDELIKGSTSMDIQFLDDEPLSIKRVRYNQSGTACYSMNNESTGKQKVKNQWQSIECNSNCEHLIKDEYGKSACNRIAWLKFFIPAISTDRLWLMKITGQQSIDNLDAYLQIQKLQGKSLKNVIFTIFLQQKEQTNCLGKTFNNYVLDISRKEDFIQTNQIPQKTEKPKDSSTKHPQNVNKSVSKQEQTEITEKATTLATSSNEKEQKGATKKVIKNKDKKAETKTNDKNETSAKATEFTNHYILESTFTEKITNKNGETKEYLIGKFYDTNDNACEIVIKPEDAEELKKCELGTLVELMIKEVAERKFAIDLKYINKLIKNVAA